MTRYRSVAGDVIDAFGHPLPLAIVPAMVAEWKLRFDTCIAHGASHLARTYARSALELGDAYIAAQKWRRASGCLSDLTMERVK